MPNKKSCFENPYQFHFMNVSICLSVFGGKYDSRIKKSWQNYARVDEISEKKVKPGEYVCPEIRSSGKKTEKYCAYNCRYCVSSRDTERTAKHQVRVVFHKSMGGWIGIRLAPRPPGHMIRPLPALEAAQSQKPTQPAIGARTKLPGRKEGTGAEAASASGEAMVTDAEMAKTVEAELAYRHLLLAGFSKQNILQLTDIRDLNQLSREHALQLIQAKAAEEEMVKRKPRVRKLNQRRKRITA